LRPWAGPRGLRIHPPRLDVNACLSGIATTQNPFFFPKQHLEKKLSEKLSPQKVHPLKQEKPIKEIKTGKITPLS
jgi:hypothetical protein